jgi:GNAT superfamily N-acetyltransferase
MGRSPVFAEGASGGIPGQDRPVSVREVRSPKDRRRFVSLPLRFHRGHANWLPPIYAEDRWFFDPEKNPSFKLSDTVLLLAYRDGVAVGRIMGIIHRRSNEIHGERNARFGFMECPEDPEVAHALLEAVEQWAQRKGMARVVGPMGFSDQDPEGFMIEGFEETPTLACTYNQDYMNRLVLDEGYRKEVDYVVYAIPVPEQMPPNQLRVIDRIARKGNFRILEFTRRKDLKLFVRPVLGLMNETFKDIYGYVPLDEEEMLALAKRYMPVLDPRFVKLVMDRDDVISGFIIGLPNFTEGIKKAKGRLFPFGVIRILIASKRARQLDLMLGGVKDKYRGFGLEVMLGVKAVESARKAGYSRIDTHRELESNFRVRSAMEHWDGVVCKRFRVYGKNL